MSEEWRPVTGYEGLYEVSGQGQVRSLSRVDRLGRHKPGALLTPVGRSHLHVTLSKNGQKRQPYVHRLVAEAFIPNPHGLPMVLHRDDNPSNNRVENLRWGTSGENRSDAVRNGIRKGGSLSAPEIREIRVRLARGDSQRSIAAQYGVDQSNISHIARGRIWTHV